ncbi:MAG: hypothetical protein RLZ60_1213 [Pseudomonadota bacterium]
MSSTNRLPDTGSTAHRRWRDIALLAGLFGFVIVGLAGLALATGWEETIAQLLRLSFLQFIVLLGLSLVNYVLRGSRWHVMARKIGLPTTLTQDLRHFIGGFAMSVTPGRVGELIRMRWIRRETGWAVERSAPMVLMDRAGDLAAMAIILALGLSFGAGGIAFGLPVAIAALLVAFVATRPRLLAGAAEFAYRLTGFFPRLMVRVRRAAGSLAAFSDPKTVIITLALGLTGWIAEGYAFHLLLLWMGADIGFWMAATIFTFSTLAGGLTGAPGGVGGAEAAMVALLSMQGVPLETSLPATAIIRVTTLWFAIGLGLLVFPFAERHSLKQAL